MAFPNRIAPVPSTLCLLLAGFVVVGCADKEAKDPTQVAAKVNGDEISVHQINNQLAGMKAIDAGKLDAASRKVLDQLIDQELLIQQSTERKLDRSSAVVQAIETAKRDIITRAYIESLTAQVNAPDANEVDAFYTANPALFSDRRIYTLRELKIAAADSRKAEIQAQTKDIKSMSEMEQWLRQAGLKFTSSVGVKAAEEFPPALLANFSSLKDGDLGVLGSNDGIVVLQLISSIQQPLDQEQARPVIERLLSSQKKSELLKAELKRLRSVANLEYVGKFADTEVVQAAATPAVVERDENASSPALAKGVSKLQ